MIRARHVKNSPRPSMDEANNRLAELGWTPSAGCWESEHVVFCFAQESYPGTMGGAAAAVTWNSADGWLSLPDEKPKNVRFV